MTKKMARLCLSLLCLALLLVLVGDRSVRTEAASPPEPNKRALVIGIGDYDSPVFPDLQYSPNDVARIEELLTSPNYGFKLTSLNDSTPDKPTRANILKYLRQVLITDSHEGDVVLFYYTGHGSSIKNTASDEPDHRDETIVPRDAARPKVDAGKLAAMKPDERKAFFDANFRDIRDKELVDVFNEAIIRKKVVLTVIIDSCHSGSAARGDEQSKEVDAVDVDLAIKPSAEEAKYHPEELGALILSAAQDYQVATGGTHDLAGHEALYSHFTAAILSALYDTPADLVSADETFQQITAKMAADGLVQTPRMDTTDGRRVQPLFGGTNIKSSVPRFIIGAENGATYLRAGRTSGLTEGDELKRVLPGGKPSISIRLKKVALDRSEIETIGDVNAEPGDTFEQTKWARAAKPDLTVYIPPATLTDAELKQATDDIKALPAANVVTDPTDPQQRVGAVAYVERIGSAAAWRVGPSRLKAMPVGPKLTLAAAKLPQATRVFAVVPPSQAVRREIVDAIQKGQLKIAITDDPSAAQYELIGRVDPATGSAGYAWMLRAGISTENAAVKQKLGAAAAAPSSMPPITSFIDANSVTGVSELIVLAQRLAKMRYLLSLSSPVSTVIKTFPYKLEVVDVATNSILRPGDVLDSRKWYEYRMRLVPGRGTAEVFPHFFIYLVDIDANGFANVGEPIEFGASPGASSRVFSAENAPAILSLARCTVSEDPLGTETIMALVMEQQSTHANALRLEGVRGRNFTARGGSEDPLTGLLSSAGDVQTRDGTISPNTWAMQHLVLRSAKLGERPSGFQDACKYPDPVTGTYK